MRKTLQILTISIFITFLAGISFAQNNYKIRQATSMNGQKSETTIYVKGPRKRTEGGGFMGMGADVATVEQCDLKRDLKINDKKKMYAVEPFDDGLDTAATPAVKTAATKTKPAPTVKGGVVTYTSNVNDTGERKQMFGLNARHIKTSMSMEASPDACAKENMKMETDGWYVDLPEFSCPITMRPQVPQMPSGTGEGGCRDRMQFKTTGGGKLGFPLTETRTMSMGEGDMSFTQTTETLEFSKATLDAVLFDIPQGYALSGNSQDLYGKPDMAAMMKGMANSGDDNDEDKPKARSNGNSMPSTSTSSQPAGDKKSGMIRIGVYAPTNKNGENISTANMQSFLVQQLTSGNVEAIAVGSEADARAANCDYVLTSDFSKLKQSASSKIGGMFGKVTNTDTSSAKNYEAQVDFKLVFLPTGQAAAQNKGTSKSESDVDRAAQNALSQEASAVIKAATAK